MIKLNGQHIFGISLSQTFRRYVCKKANVIMGHWRVIADITSYLPEAFDTTFYYGNRRHSNVMKNKTTNIGKKNKLLSLIASSIYKPPDYLQRDYYNVIDVHGLEDSSRISAFLQINA